MARLMLDEADLDDALFEDLSTNFSYCDSTSEGKIISEKMRMSLNYY